MPSVRAIDLRKIAALMSPDEDTGAAQRFGAEAIELIRRERLVEASWSYQIVPLGAPPGDILHAGGETFHAPWLVPEAGELTALACAVCTLGPRLEQRVTEAFARRRASLALALDRLGNALLLALGRLMQDRLLADTARRGLTMAGELRAGDPGLALDAQPAVLRLAQASEIGVTLTSGQVMRPVKSTSMVLGVGIDLPPARWSRCDHCPSRPNCRVARRADVSAELASAG